MTSLQMRWGIAVSCAIALAASCPARSQETCGANEPLFRDGFENDGIPIATLPAAGTPLSLVIDPSFDSTTVGTDRITVFGTLGGPPATGVARDDRGVEQAGTQWLTQIVRLAPGPNTVTIKATTLEGQVLTRSIAVTRDDQVQPRVQLEPPGRLGFGPVRARFTLRVKSGWQVTRIRLDYDNDGSNDLDTVDLATPLIGRYVQPGIRQATGTITLDDGNPETPPVNDAVSARVLVGYLDERRKTLCAVFGHMRSKLAAQDVSGALNALHPRLHARFQPFWNELGATLPSVASQLGTIADGTLSGDSAEYLIIRPAPGPPGQFRGYRVAFAPGPDGVWRIGSM